MRHPRFQFHLLFTIVYATFPPPFRRLGGGESPRVAAAQRGSATSTETVPAGPRDGAGESHRFSQSSTSHKLILMASSKLHGLPGESAHLLLEPRSVHRPNLVNGDGRAFRQTAVCRLNHNFPGKRWLRELGTDGSHDGDRTVLVGDVIIADDGGPGLLRSAPSRIALPCSSNSPVRNLFTPVRWTPYGMPAYGETGWKRISTTAFPGGWGGSP